MGRGVTLLITVVCLLGGLGCRTTSPEAFDESLYTRLVDRANRINSEFVNIRKAVTLFAGFIREVYLHKDRLSDGLTRSQYRLHAGKALYKPVDDGGSALFVSGAVPVNQHIRDRARFTEYFDLFMKPIASTFPEITQVYFNDPESFCRIYPYFDVLMVLEPELDVRQFNFFYMADPEHNPERKSLWINTPYLDPAGRGWTVSAISPVYVHERFVGVAGIDVTINRLVSRHVEACEDILLIVDNEGLVVAVDTRGASILQLPPLVDHKYIATIRSDTFQSEEFNLFKNSDHAIRALAVALVRNGQPRVRTMLQGQEYTFLSAPIPELGWTLWQIVQN